MVSFFSSKYLVALLLIFVMLLSVSGLIRPVPASSFTEWTLPSSDSGPFGVSVSGGLAYFAEEIGNKIGELNPSTGVFTEWSIPTSGATPVSISVSGGSIYFTEYDVSTIGELNPSTGVFKEWTIPTSDSEPNRIFVSGGLVYFTENLANKIGELNPSTGVFTEWTIPTSDSEPIGIYVSGGLVYFTEGGGNKIGELDSSTGVFTEWTVPTSSSNPIPISVSDGLIYFTEGSGNKIGELNPSTGVFNEWVIPTTASEPKGISVSGGLVYFTEWDGNNIGLLTLSPVATVYTSVPVTLRTLTTTGAVSTASDGSLATNTVAAASASTRSVTEATTSAFTSLSDKLTAAVYTLTSVTVTAPTNNTAVSTAFVPITIEVAAGSASFDHDAQLSLYVNSTSPVCPVGNATNTGEFTCDYQLEQAGTFEANVTATENLPTGKVTLSSANYYFTAGPVVEEISLVQGWNLISTPIIPANTAVGAVLASQIGSGDFTVTWSYQNGKWLEATLTGGKLSGTLTTFQDGYGYWIYMSKADNLFIVGSDFPPQPSTPPSYALSIGWNLVGFTPESAVGSESTNSYLSSLDGNYNRVYLYVNSSGTWTENAANLSPGEAIWIYVTAPVTLRP